ncbi:putative invertase inhibitor [Castanea sativa]|uniref:putative invertase inhibitor n=1 Tax=Castanea sativa TaxID=21020 RepID=UPI003F650226
MDDLEDPNKVLMDGIDRAFVEKVCKNSIDYDFCLSTLLSDPEGLTAVPYRLGLVATSVSLGMISKINDGEIGNILIKVTDPVVRTRITDCQIDMSNLYKDMERARDAAGTQSYKEEAKSLASAQMKIVECNNRFKSPPTSESPISSSISKIEKLINICAAVLNMIPPS